MQAIKQISKSMNVEFTIVHIETAGFYRCYDTDTENKCITRGSLLLDVERKERAILFTTGNIQEADVIRIRRRPGTPRALEIQLFGDSEKRIYTIREIGEQVIMLSRLNWNSIDIDNRLRITLKYSHKAATIARNLGQNQAQTLLERVDIRDLM